MRAEKLKQLEEEFYREINTDKISNSLQVESSVIELIASYWKLKRKVCNVYNSMWGQISSEQVHLPTTSPSVFEMVYIKLPTN